jgi:type IV pilus assembly protein PilF
MQRFTTDQIQATADCVPRFERLFGELTSALVMVAFLLGLLGLLGLTGCETTNTSTRVDRTDRSRPDTNSVIPLSTEESSERTRARIRLELAAGYYQQGNSAVALEELRVALQIDPNYAAAYGILGLVYMGLGDEPKAKESFVQALRIAPKDADLNNNYGWYLCQTTNPQESIPYFNRALEDRLYTTPAKPLHNAGICSLRFNDLQGAENYFRRAFQVEPGNPVTNYQLSLLNLSKGQHEQARFYAKRLLTNFAPNSQALFLAMCIEKKAGDRNAEANFAAQLRRNFSASPEATRLQNNDCVLTP